MRKEKKQNILTILLIIALLVLIGLIVFIIYDVKNSNKEPEVKVPEVSENTNNDISKTEEETPVKEEEQKEEYIGKEESETIQEQDTKITNDEKAIQLAKQTWGEDDSVTFSIEEKKGDMYYIAVKSNATVISWYEINTNTWEISEFY